MILFLFHELTLTGAPIVLRDFLKWRKSAHPASKFEVLAARGGPLEDSLAEICPVTVLFRGLPEGNSLFHRALQRHHIQKLLRRWNSVKLIYANTVATGDLLSVTAPLSCPRICHAHELQSVVSQVHSYSTKNWEIFDRVIAVAQAVKQNLETNYDVPSSKIKVCPEFVNCQEIDKRLQNSLISEPPLQLPKNALVVGMCGTLNPNKGADLWLDVARHVLAQTKSSPCPVHFVWVGGQKSGAFFENLQRQVCDAGLEGRVHFLGHTSQPFHLMQRFDILAFTSREDSFPLAIMETATLGKPIVCFADSGGAPEFVGEDCGFCVPYLDTQSMANRVLTLLDNEELRRTLGYQARRRCTQHYDIHVVAPQIEAVIQSLVCSS